MKCKYCGMYLENVDEESLNGMAHTIKCQTKRIHELENEKNSDDIRTALDTLCTRLINRFCKSGTTKSELLAPILEEIRQTKKELEEE